MPVAATPNGLIVPVIHDADRKDIQQLAADIQRLTERARGGAVKPEDLQDGTFTVTSIGNIGGLISTPVINHPQVAIMGVGKIERRPIFDENDRVIPAELLYLSFSFDHRVIDGDVGAQFSNTIIERLENPAALLLDL